MTDRNAQRKRPDGFTTPLRQCRECAADISHRRTNARLCERCSDRRQATWNATHYILRNEIEKYISGIESASEIVARLGNEELSGRLREAAGVIRGDA